MATREAAAPRRSRVALATWPGPATRDLPSALAALTLAADFVWWRNDDEPPDAVIVVAGEATPDRSSTADALVERLRRYASTGGAILGVGGGVEALLAAELLPGVLEARPPDLAARHVRVEGRATPFSWAIPAGRILPTGEPAVTRRYLATDDAVAALAAQGRVILRRCDAAGGATPGASGVAGLCDETGRIVGLLATPETPHDLDSPLGRQILACFRPR